MKRILVLSTWFPYPLQHGAKIRAYHLIRALSAEHQIFLISFADEEIEPGWIDHMRNFCTNVEVIDHPPFMKNRFRSILGWFSPLPSSLFSGYSVAMERRVKSIVLDWKPDVAMALTVITAPYLVKIDGCRKILDIDNILTRMLYESFRQTTGFINRLRAWAAWQKFNRFEKRTINLFDVSLIVSEEDRQWVSSHLSTPLEKLHVVPNGVDLYDDEIISLEETNTLIYNGSVTYDVNLDAMVYFVNEILPLIRRQINDIRLTITGKYNGVPLGWIPQDGSVKLTGFVDDIRPIVKSSAVCVVPLRRGAGTRLKILEAMALGTPVVSTPKGVEGLDVVNGKHVLICETTEDFASQTIHLLMNAALRRKLSINARQLVAENYNWVNLERNWCRLVDDLLS